MLEAEMLKKVVPHSVATAFASRVLPVPGGPYSSKPFHGDRIPVNNCGYYKENQKYVTDYGRRDLCATYFYWINYSFLNESLGVVEANDVIPPNVGVL